MSQHSSSSSAAPQFAVGAARDSSGYLPIESYAAIGNGETVALVGRDGSIDWCCLPRFDSPFRLGRLLDSGKGGFFSLAPRGESSVERAYQERSNVLSTVFRTSEGVVRVVDFMPLGEARIVRRADAVEGRATLTACFRPAWNARRCEPGEAGKCLVVSEGDGELEINGPSPWRRDSAGTWCSECRLETGQRATWSLAYGAEARSRGADSEDRALQDTLDYWSRWFSGTDYQGAHREAVMRSALALKLLHCAPTGAIVAAPTTSLPEQIGGSRNWDYRYAWLRDSGLVIDAFMSIGLHEEAMSFWDWIERLGVGEERPAILYTVDGSPCPAERTLEELEGYRGSRPVREGNGASAQVQHDGYGYLIDAASQCQTLMREPHPDLAPILRRVTDRVAEGWNQDGHGLWEIRGPRRHYVHSKLMSWVALDRALQLAERGWLEGDTQRWSSGREALRRTILDEGFNRQIGSFVQTLGGSELDAAALLVPIVGLLPADDWRVLSTIEAIGQGLGHDDLLYRYREPDGIEGSEGAFVMCSFWRVEALALAGRLEEAHELFESLARRANDVGLLSEEIDPASGAFLGNFPQAFSHLSLIRAALALERDSG